jgi:hypothetical protein
MTLLPVAAATFDFGPLVIIMIDLAGMAYHGAR